MTSRSYPFAFVGVGEPGSSILNGSGTPSPSLGRDGDFYIDTDVYDIYGPKAAGVWGSGTALSGGGGGGGSLPPGGSLGEYLVITDPFTPTYGWSSAGLVQPGSVVGYVYRQTGGGLYDHAWGPVRELPEPDIFGADDGNFLQWNGSNWVYTLVNEVNVPSSPGDDGKFLQANGGGWSWQTVRQVPAALSPGDDGKVLTANSGTYAWEDPAASGLTYRQVLSSSRRT
jgi:hypothetical protein